MDRWSMIAGAACLALLSGCATQAPEQAPVPPMPENLSHWQVPALVQPAKRGAPVPQGPDTRKPTAEEKVFDYTPGTTFKIPMTVGLPLDIQFEPGEERRTIAGGDPEPVEQGQEEKRWSVKEGKSGKDGTMQEHLMVLPRELGVKMGVVVSTTRRVYSLVFESVKSSPVRFVRWRYSDGVPEVAPEKEARMLPDPGEARLFHVGYQVVASQPTPEWTPRYVADDGQKLYIVYKEITLFKTVPLVRALTAQGPSLINSRQYKNVVIIDGLPSKIELRLGTGLKDHHADIVTISQGDLATIECPTDPQCPLWPHEGR